MTGAAGRQTDKASAVVIFGATGDLAKLETFPALVGLVDRGVLDVPVIGVAKSGWGLDQATGAGRDRPGRIAVQDDLTIKGHPEISVIGDMMSLRKLPGVAEVAMQSGLYSGHRIKRQLTGQPSAKAIQVPRSRIGSLCGSRSRRRLGRADEAVELSRLGDLAVHGSTRASSASATARSS